MKKMKRYRPRRAFVPIFHRGEQIAHLIWKDGAMEAWTIDGHLVGRYPTRREAASALWIALHTQKGIERWTTKPPR